MCKFRSIFEIDFLNKLFLFELRSILEVYFISENSGIINKGLLKHEQSTLIYFFLFLYSIYASFLGSSLLLDFKDLKYKSSILKVYLKKYTSDIVFSVREGFLKD